MKGWGYAITLVEKSIPVVSVTPSVKFVLYERGLPKKIDKASKCISKKKYMNLHFKVYVYSE